MRCWRGIYEENLEGEGGQWGFLSREYWTMFSISRVIAIEEELKDEQEVLSDYVSRYD